MPARLLLILRAQNRSLLKGNHVKLEAARETAVTVVLKLDEEYAEKTQDSLGQVINALDKLPDLWFQGLVSDGAIDNLQALRITISNALEGN